MTMRRLRAVALAFAAALAAAPAAAQDLGLQLDEIRTLVREKRYPLALESLRLVARQIQDLRLEALTPAFPSPPPGWTATPPLSLLEEGEIWSDRLEAQRSYAPPGGAARIDLVIDLHSPHAPAAILGLNALVTAADPNTRIQEIAGMRARVRFVPDSGEGEVRVPVGRDILVTARGRGIDGADAVVRLVERVDYSFLRAWSGM